MFHCFYVSILQICFMIFPMPSKVHLLFYKLNVAMLIKMLLLFLTFFQICNILAYQDLENMNICIPFPQKSICAEDLLWRNFFPNTSLILIPHFESVWKGNPLERAAFLSKGKKTAKCTLFHFNNSPTQFISLGKVR